MIYSYLYGASGVDRTEEIVELQNGDLIIAGENIPSGDPILQILRFQLQNSTVSWHKQMKNGIESKVKTMEIVDDSSIVFGGYYVYNITQFKDFASKFDTNGNQKWNLRFFEQGYDEVKDLKATSSNVTLLLTQNQNMTLVSIPLSGAAGNLAHDANEIGWSDVSGTTFQSSSLTINDWTSLTSSNLIHSLASLNFLKQHSTPSTNPVCTENCTVPQGPGGGSNSSSDVWLAVGLTIASVILLAIVIIVCFKFKKSVNKSKELSRNDERLKSRSESPMVSEKDHLAITTDQIVIDVTAPRNGQHLIIPPRFICPISHQIMSDPVTNKHKDAFERVCMEFKLHYEKHKIPPLLITNNKLKREIETWLIDQPVELIRKRKALRQKISNWISKRGRQNLERDPVLKDIVINFDQAFEAK